MATIISGRTVFFLRLKIRWSIFCTALSVYRNPFYAFSAVLFLLKIRKNTRGNLPIRKMVKHNRKIFIGIYMPKFKSKQFKSFVLNSIDNYKKVPIKRNRFNNVFFAITKKCIYNCEHCFEGMNLNKKDTLDVKAIEGITQTLYDLGVNQLFFTGGEPMLKIDTLLQIIPKIKNEIDCWIYTSGYLFNKTNAIALKKAGLTGVLFSLDHYLPEKHNRFRGDNNSYDRVIEGIKNAQKQGLITALSFCVTKNNATIFHLQNYMVHAKKLGVSFVQFLEPKPLGNYHGKDILLKPFQLHNLEKVFIDMNSNKAFSKFPVILYHGYHQRRIGCFNGGQSGLYIDANGQLNSCPFCNKKFGSLLSPDFHNNLNLLTLEGCPSYQMNSNIT